MSAMGTISVSDCIECQAPAGAIPVDRERRPLESWPVMALRWLSGRIDKRRSRIALSELTDDQLRDIGLTRTEAQIEAYRSFWD